MHFFSIQPSCKIIHNLLKHPVILIPFSLPLKIRSSKPFLFILCPEVMAYHFLISNSNVLSSLSHSFLICFLGFHGISSKSLKPHLNFYFLLFISTSLFTAALQGFLKIISCSYGCILFCLQRSSFKMWFLLVQSWVYPCMSCTAIFTTQPDIFFLTNKSFKRSQLTAILSELGW